MAARPARFLACAAAAASCSATASAATPFSTVLDGATALHRFDGHGALSAGASSRLLWDYPEPQRSQILDYLFKPQFGASLAILKVEIGGDAQSTDGTEPSHMHTRSDLACGRGYETWLINQAASRNPDILTYGLSWGAPSWVGNGTYYSDDNVDYQTQWVRCVKNVTGRNLSYLGWWNERVQPDVDYAVKLRQSLDAAGFGSTKVIAMDGGWDGDVITQAAANASFAAAFDGAGLHYPCGNAGSHNGEQLRGIGKSFWFASEDYWQNPTWEEGAREWGQRLSGNYVTSNMTATIAWSLIDSFYGNFACSGTGLMRAATPWSGNYEASAPIWVSAHWGQFVQPGARFLATPGGGSGTLPPAPGGPPGAVSGGTYVTLVPAAGLSDVTIIAETLDTSQCFGTRSVGDVAAVFSLAPGLPGPGSVLQVWRTTADAYFTRLADVTVSPARTLNVTLTADSITTISTVQGARRGGFPGSPIPAPAPFSVPYSDDFSTYAEDAMARFLSDQGGSWAVRGGRLAQLAPADPGGDAWAPNPDPLTIFGGETWDDYTLTVTFASFGGPVPGGVASAARSQSSTTARARKEHARRAPQRARRAPQRARRAPQRAPLSSIAALATSRGGTSRRRKGDAASLLEVADCDATDAAQAWAVDSPAAGYLQNAATHTCLNVYGCQASDITLYQCVTSGGTCAGASSYANLQWALSSPAGVPALVSALDGRCLAYNGSAFFDAPCAASAAQTWTRDAATGLVAHGASGGCLSAATRGTYVQACVRITTFDGFDAVEAMPGYCLAVKASGAWSLLVGGAVAASGKLPAGSFDPRASHALSVAAHGPAIEAALDGAPLASINDETFKTGNAALGSGWHAAEVARVDVSA